jgi:hypothetical protein
MNNQPLIQNTDYRSQSMLEKMNYDITQINSILGEGTWIAVSEGMGCYTAIRKMKKTGILEGLYMDSQDHYNETKSLYMQTFVKDYIFIANHPIIYHEKSV